MPRRSRIEGSAHREEIEHLIIDQRWSSRAVEQYLALKYGERIAASSIRTWRERRVRVLADAGRLPPLWESQVEDDTPTGRVNKLLAYADRIPDVMSERVRLIQLQEARIRIDAEHEIAIGKQFASNGKEIDLLNRMLNDLKTDMQELGLWPSAAASPTTVVNAWGGSAAAVSASSAPAVTRTSLAEVLPDVDRQEAAAILRQAGRSLVLLQRERDDSGD